ncbi:unnamed protein product [Timema podura]|uniref:Uncharacterized protein n=1 Tax=Timema podura TaxID=61482 RepID=A0ABN7NZR2_TIMPD|nr:unnamed protein product [Timema podura]
MSEERCLPRWWMGGVAASGAACFTQCFDTVKEKHKSKENAVGMRYLRNVCGQTRMDRDTNEWVLKECGLK